MQYSVTILDWSNEYTLTRTAHTHVHHTIISPTASITTTWDHNRSSRVVAPRRYAGLGAKSSPHLCIRHVAHQTENQHSSKHGWTSHHTPSNTHMWFSNVLSFFRRIALLPLQQLNYSSLTILTQRPHTSGIKSDWAKYTSTFLLCLYRYGFVEYIVTSLNFFTFAPVQNGTTDAAVRLNDKRHREIVDIALSIRTLKSSMIPNCLASILKWPLSLYWTRTAVAFGSSFANTCNLSQV